jgi:hypothetical protein
LDLTPVSQGSAHLQEEDEILAIAEFLINEIQSELSTDLLKEEYRLQHETEDVHPQTGHCYVASEALYWLLGGPNTDLFTPVVGRIEGESHWAIRYNREGQNDLYFDPTSEQFGGLSREDHAGMTGTGFMSRQPSKRCRKLLVRIRKELFPAWEPDGHPGILDEYAESGGSKAYSGPSSSSSSGDPEEPEEEEDSDTGESWFDDKDYKYSAISDTYIFRLNTYSGSALTVPGEVIRDIVEKYSNYDGDAQTINQIASEAGIPRDAFREMKEALGVTHDSPPHTDEEFEEILESGGSVEDMAQDDVQKAKWNWRQNYDKKRYNDLKKQARRWQNVYQELKELSNKQADRLAKHAENYEVRPVEVPDQDGQPEAALVYNLQDLHFGKQRYDSTTDIEAYKEELLKAAERGIRRAATTADIQKVYVVCGGDLSHVDTYEGTTTKGTPQDLVCNPEQIENHCEKFMVAFIDLCRQLGVKVETVPTYGNHDRRSSLSIHRYLQAWFKTEDDVRTPRDWHDRVYRVWRDHFLLVTHGDMKKKQFRKLPQIAIKEARAKVADSQFTTVFTGHLHHELAEMDDAGFKYYQAPSPSDTDRYHSKQGYVGSRDAIQGVLLFDGHPEDMIVNTAVKKPYA